MVYIRLFFLVEVGLCEQHLQANRPHLWLWTFMSLHEVAVFGGIGLLVGVLWVSMGRRRGGEG